MKASRSSRHKVAWLERHLRPSPHRRRPAALAVAVADRLAGDGARRIEEKAGGQLYGAWRSQIGRPRDEVQAISVWPQGVTAAAAGQSPPCSRARPISACGRQRSPDAHAAPDRHGSADAPGQLRLSLVRGARAALAGIPRPLRRRLAGLRGRLRSRRSIGLWQATGDRTGTSPDEVTGAGLHGGVRSLLLTRRPNLAMGTLQTARGRGRGGGARQAQPPLRPLRLDGRIDRDAADRHRPRRYRARWT